MYVLAEMRDIVSIKPWQFDQDLKLVIEDELNKKFANKVIYQLGLCVALFDILKIEDSYIFPGDGSSHTRVTFRYVIFRPFLDEVLVGNYKQLTLNRAFRKSIDSSQIERQSKEFKQRRRLCKHAILR